MGTTAPDPLTVQVGGSHYKDMAIQPLEYIIANGMDFCTGAVVKYVSRKKGSQLEDFKKARHFLDVMIAQMEKAGSISWPVQRLHRDDQP